MRWIGLEVQVENIYGGLTEKSKLSFLSMLRHDGTQFHSAQAARTRHAGDLKLCRCRRNVRIQSRSRRGDQIYRNCCARILRMELLYVTFHALHELTICWPEIRSAPARCDGVIAVASSRGPGMKVPIGGKGLTDNPRSHNLSVFLNQLAIRLGGKKELPQSRHHQRV